MRILILYILPKMTLVLTCRYKIISLPLTFCNVVLLFSFKTLPFLKSCTEPDYHQRPRTLPKTKLVDIIDSFLAQQLHQQCCRYLPFFFQLAFRCCPRFFPCPPVLKRRTRQRISHSMLILKTTLNMSWVKI